MPVSSWKIETFEGRRMDGWMDGWMDGLHEHIHTCLYIWLVSWSFHAHISIFPQLIWNWSACLKWQEGSGRPERRAISFLVLNRWLRETRDDCNLCCMSTVWTVTVEKIWHIICEEGGGVNSLGARVRVTRWVMHICTCEIHERYGSHTDGLERKIIMLSSDLLTLKLWKDTKRGRGGKYWTS